MAIAGGSALLVVLPSGKLEIKPYQQSPGEDDTSWQVPAWGAYKQRGAVLGMPIMVRLGFRVLRIYGFKFGLGVVHVASWCSYQQSPAENDSSWRTLHGERTTPGHCIGHADHGGFGVWDLGFQAWASAAVHVA